MDTGHGYPRVQRLQEEIRYWAEYSEILGRVFRAYPPIVFAEGEPELVGRRPGTTGCRDGGSGQCGQQGKTSSERPRDGWLSA